MSCAWEVTFSARGHSLTCKNTQRHKQHGRIREMRLAGNTVITLTYYKNTHTHKCSIKGRPTGPEDIDGKYPVWVRLGLGWQGWEHLLSVGRSQVDTLLQKYISHQVLNGRQKNSLSNNNTFLIIQPVGHNKQITELIQNSRHATIWCVFMALCDSEDKHISDQIYQIFRMCSSSSAELPHPERLQQVDLPIVSNEICHHFYGFITDNMICTSTRHGGMDICIVSVSAKLSIKLSTHTFNRAADVVSSLCPR